ncbi:MAG: AAA family ATPase [Betaproteobacteria bacterium]|nr:AAA family ATPase [Betaproteobacteria bacterium]
MYLRTVTLKNTGPIESFDLTLPFQGEQPKPVLLVGKNGSGKSTAISFVVNALVGMKQHVFDDIEVEKGRVYRIRSPLAINGTAEFYFARLAFDKGVVLTEWQLNRPKTEYADPSAMQALDPAWDQLPAHETSFFNLNMGKLADARLMEEMLDKNCLLYFPADRFEPPDWLNIEDLSSDLKLPEPERMKGRTTRRIFSRNRLKPTLDWLNSVIFDMMVSEHHERFVPIALPVTEDSPVPQGNNIVSVRVKVPGKAHAVFSSIQDVLRKVICEKETDILQLGIGDRKSRIINASVVRDGTPIRVIKDLMSLSAGESALFCLFASIVRDADLSSMSFHSPGEIEGLVVIDEADMHLHVGLQYRVLPELIALFPKVQFILSAHAPMVAIGLENKLGEDSYEIIELPGATHIPPESYSEFREAFNVFTKTKAFHEELLMAISSTSKPILLLEGKSDAQLVSTAWIKLKPGTTMPFDVVPCGIEPDEEKRSGGAGMLRRTLEFLSAVTDRPLCGIFDFDRAGYEGFAGLNKHVFSAGVDAEHKYHAKKKVHASLLPVLTERSDFVNTDKPIHSFMSIEHYFADTVLQKFGFSLAPVVAGSKVFEIDGTSKQKIAFANAVNEFDVTEFMNFQILFDRLNFIGFI